MKQEVILQFIKKKPFFELLLTEVCERFLKKKNLQYSQERGHRMAVFANDWIGGKIFLQGVYERAVLECLLDFCSALDPGLKTTTVLDIGANVGNHALYFSKFFSAVMAFEPNPHTYKLLDYNAGYMTNVTAYNIGLGEKNERLTLFEDPENYGGSSTVYKDQKTTQADVEIKRLDDFLRDMSLKIGLIKIDVEGMECPVLKGGQETLLVQTPLIALEQHPHDFLPGTHETLSTQFLKDLGYFFCWIEGGIYQMPGISKQVNNILSAFWGTPYRIVMGDRIPCRPHPVLIAVPARYRGAVEALMRQKGW